jgi:hypothetical protein
VSPSPGTAGEGRGEGSSPNSNTARVLAWFDTGDPFVIEQPLAQGRLLILTSGWHPTDSQLALSTKFVPLIEGLLRRNDGTTTESQYAVDDPIALPQVTGTRQLIAPDGAKMELAAGATKFDGANRPGIYQLIVNSEATPVAVNLAPEESRTTPVAAHELSQWGARLGNAATASAAELAAKRQLQMIELENRQKLWRWLILAVLAILAVETALAGRLAHRTLEQQVTT